MTTEKSGSKRGSVEEPWTLYARNLKMCVVPAAVGESGLTSIQDFHNQISEWNFTLTDPKTDSVCRVSHNNQTFYGITVGHALQDGKLVVYDADTRKLHYGIGQEEVDYFKPVGMEATFEQQKTLRTYLDFVKNHFTLSVVREAQTHCKKLFDLFAWQVASTPFTEEMSRLCVSKISYELFNFDTYDLVWCLTVTVPVLHDEVYPDLAYSVFDNYDILVNSFEDETAGKERELVWIKLKQGSYSYNDADVDDVAKKAAKEIVQLLFHPGGSTNRLRRCRLYFVFWHFHQAATAVYSVFETALKEAAAGKPITADPKDILDRLQCYALFHHVMMYLQTERILLHEPNRIVGIPKPVDYTYESYFYPSLDTAKGEVVNVQLLGDQHQQLTKKVAGNVIGYLWEMSSCSDFVKES